MGYRTYIGAMPRREYNKIKSMTREQLVEYYKLEQNENDNYIGMNVFDFGERLYEFGKYTDFEPPKKSLRTFFKNKELNKYFTNENDFAIVTAEFLEYIIETYKKRITDYYNDMMNPFSTNSEFLNSVQTEYNYPNDKHTFDFTKITEEEQTALYKIIEHVKSMRWEWYKTSPLNLKPGESITHSWKYEYSIFELTRIYNSFDWKKNVMVYYGY